MPIYKLIKEMLIQMVIFGLQSISFPFCITIFTILNSVLSLILNAIP